MNQTTIEPIPVTECGCCDCFHRYDYAGDCRNNAERFADMQDAADRLKAPVLEVCADGSYSTKAIYPSKGGACSL